MKKNILWLLCFLAIDIKPGEYREAPAARDASQEVPKENYAQQKARERLEIQKLQEQQKAERQRLADKPTNTDKASMAKRQEALDKLNAQHAQELKDLKELQNEKFLAKREAESKIAQEKEATEKEAAYQKAQAQKAQASTDSLAADFESKNAPSKRATIEMDRDRQLKDLLAEKNEDAELMPADSPFKKTKTALESFQRNEINLLKQKAIIDKKIASIDALLDTGATGTDTTTGKATTDKRNQQESLKKIEEDKLSALEIKIIKNNAELSKTTADFDKIYNDKKSAIEKEANDKLNNVKDDPAAPQKSRDELTAERRERLRKEQERKQKEKERIRLESIQTIKLSIEDALSTIKNNTSSKGLLSPDVINHPETVLSTDQKAQLLKAFRALSREDILETLNSDQGINAERHAQKNVIKDILNELLPREDKIKRTKNSNDTFAFTVETPISNAPQREDVQAFIKSIIPDISAMRPRDLPKGSIEKSVSDIAKKLNLTEDQANTLIKTLTTLKDNYGAKNPETVLNDYFDSISGSINEQTEAAERASQAAAKDKLTVEISKVLGDSSKVEQAEVLDFIISLKEDLKKEDSSQDSVDELVEKFAKELNLSDDQIAMLNRAIQRSKVDTSFSFWDWLLSFLRGVKTGQATSGKRS